MKSFRPFLPALNLRPGLLISPNFERSCYTIYVTDGTYLWKQSVSSSELQSLSTSYDSPIDAEDPEQLKILFGKLQQGLSCQGDGREGTETKLLHIEDPSFNSAGVPKKLVIHTTVPLDAPLPVLEWRFYLDLTPQYEFTSTITLPLMRLVGLYQTKTTELLEQIKSKDNIITKLKDNAEMQKKGAVNEIFHNKRSRQGLAVFVQEEWRNSFILAGEDAGTDWLYKDQDSPRVEFQAVLGSKERVDESWWDILNSEKQHYSLGRQTSRGVIPRDTGRSKRQSPAKTRKLSPTPVPPARNEDETEDETDDDASDEITPETQQHTIAKSSGHGAKPAKEMETPKDPDDPYSRLSSEDDDDDLDGPPVRSNKAAHAERKPSPESISPPRGDIKSKLGALRSRKRSVTPKAATPTVEMPESDDEATASEDEAPAKAQPTTTAQKPNVGPPLYTVASPKRATSLSSAGKPKLGALGRRSTPDVPVMSPTSETPEKPPSPLKLGSRLGAIGATKHKEVTKGPKSASPEAASSKEKAPSSIEETPVADPLAQEAADRKRKELERALEEKKKAPARKKRKF